MGGKRSLVMDVRVGDSVTLDGGRIVIQVMEKSGQRAKLSITANAEVSISRKKPASSGAKAAQSGIRMVPSS
ncbi:hypothetical protein D9M73_73330 [compost metagenome]